MILPKLLCATALVGLFFGPAAAEDEGPMREALIEALAEAPVGEVASRAGFSPEQQPHAEEQLRDLFGDEKIAALVAEEIMRTAPSEMRGDPEAAPLLVKSYGAGAMRNLARMYVALLPIEEFRSYHQLQERLLAKMNPGECAENVIKDEKSVAERLKVELAAMKDEPAAFVQEWLGFNSAGMKAMAHGTREEQRSGNNEAWASAEEALMESFATHLDAHPRGVELFDAYQNPHTSAPQDVCEVYQIRMDAALAVEDDLVFYTVAVASDR